MADSFADIRRALDEAAAATESGGVTLSLAGRIRALSSDKTIEANRLRSRAVAAETVCVLYGWTGVHSDDSYRDKALFELWVEWLHSYRAAGGSDKPKDHPELSDARVRELAARRDATVARTMAALRELVEVPLTTTKRAGRGAG